MDTNINEDGTLKETPTESTETVETVEAEKVGEDQPTGPIVDAEVTDSEVTPETNEETVVENEESQDAPAEEASAGDQSEVE